MICQVVVVCVDEGGESAGGSIRAGAKGEYSKIIELLRWAKRKGGLGAVDLTEGESVGEWKLARMRGGSERCEESKWGLMGAESDRRSGA